MQRNSLLQSRCELIRCGILFCLAALVCQSGPGTASAFQEQPETTLRPGFKPPRDTPEFYQIEDEKITEKDFDDWNKQHRINYQAALRSRSLDAVIDGRTVKDRVNEGIRMRVARFSLKSQRSELRDRRRELIQEIDFNSKDEVRQHALQQVVEQAKTLLTGHFHVRLHAVFLVSDLELEPETIGVGAKPAVAYAGGVPILLAVLSESLDGKPIQQPDGVKIPAAHGLRKILNGGALPKQPNEKTRIAIARVLLAEIDGNPDEAYEFVLLHALADVGIALIAPAEGGAPRPEIVTALSRVMVDTTRSLRNRCRAARLLGRTPMPGGIESGPIAWGTVQLGQQIGNEYGTRIHRLHAVFYFQDLYYAYVPPPGESTSDGKPIRAGLNSTLKSPEVNHAYGVIRPIMAFFVKSLMASPGAAPVAIPQPLLQEIGATKKPASMSIWDGDPPIDQKKSRSPEERRGTPAG